MSIDTNVKVTEIRTMNLPCKLTDAEVIARADTMAAQSIELTKLEDEKKASAARFKDRIETLEGEHGKVVREVRERQTYRDVDVRDEYRFGADEVVTVRLDTGTVVERRPMTANDRQELLPLAEEEAGRTPSASDLEAEGKSGKGRVN